jgi:hypothetical protein
MTSRILLVGYMSRYVQGAKRAECKHSLIIQPDHNALQIILQLWLGISGKFRSKSREHHKLTSTRNTIEDRARECSDCNVL